MAKAIGVLPRLVPREPERPQVSVEEALAGMFMVAIPEATFVLLNQEATKRGISVPVLLGAAISEYLMKTEDK